MSRSPLSFEVKLGHDMLLERERETEQTGGGGAAEKIFTSILPSCGFTTHTH